MGFLFGVRIDNAAHLFVERVRVGKDNPAGFAICGPRMADQTGHADGFVDHRIEPADLPIRCSVRADGHEPPVVLGFAAHVKQNPAVLQFDGDSFAGIHKGRALDLGAVAGDKLAALPARAVVVTVNQRHIRGPVSAVLPAHVSRGTVGKPDRNDQASVAQL